MHRPGDRGRESSVTNSRLPEIGAADPDPTLSWIRCRGPEAPLDPRSRVRHARAVSSAIRYAQNGDINIAYRVVGSGPRDLIFIQGNITNLDIYWDDRRYREFCERLAAFSRLILFDKRGMGLSDRVETGTMEDRMDDVRAVLDAVGSDRAVVL
jgi:hypothetical protein